MTQPDRNENETEETAPEVVLPATQRDLQARREAGYETAVTRTVNPNEVNDGYAVEGNDTSAYVGVDPIYMTYANDTEKPLKGDGVEDEVCKELTAGLAYSEAPKEERVQTLGTGSSDPHVLGATSGSAVAHTVVDRKKVEDEKDKVSRKVLGQPAKEKEVAPLRRSEDVSGAVKAPSSAPKPPTPATPPSE